MANVNPLPSAPVVTYKNFTDANPTNFDGTQGATALLQWYEKMESVFFQIECPDDKRTRFTTDVFEEGALIWWVKEKSTRGDEAAIALPWNKLKDLMNRRFCPPNELMNLEAEFWNLKQEGGEHAAYTTYFNELSVLVPHLVTFTSRASTSISEDYREKSKTVSSAVLLKNSVTPLTLLQPSLITMSKLGL
ncbi:uncharacterized protein LOC143558914 [Bidens hawaiensis]|uniref:uncharacterized protein LOC143558914 n=1 Tax=Bidens hawaiensis TaxID=980011 RepID=UPI00404B3A26